LLVEPVADALLDILSTISVLRRKNKEVDGIYWPEFFMAMLTPAVSKLTALPVASDMAASSTEGAV